MSYKHFECLLGFGFCFVLCACFGEVNTSVATSFLTK